nr:B3 domain-containing protein Os01g0234100-like [Tanacetum cinerariifolium]
QHQNNKKASNLQRAENMDIDLHQYNDQDNTLIMYDQSVDETEYADSQVSEGLRFSQSVIEFKDIKSVDDFSIAFEEMGMKVGFLRARISKLKGLLFESKELLEAKRIEQLKAEEEVRLIKEKLCGVQEVIKNLNVEMETLKLKGQNLEQVFHKEADAPW